MAELSIEYSQRPMARYNALTVDRRARDRSVLAVVALLVLTECVYLRPEFLAGVNALVGMDYDQLHIRRIIFAREALFGIRHALPAWYPREALGSPFAANVQSFPWIPVRLLLLLLDPSIAYAPAIGMAAALAAIFTWLYCRRAGLTRTGAAAAAWTFACAGFFASRVMAGHLPLLEAYPALPLLLWLADRALAPERGRRHRFDLAVLALCTTAVVAAGHPQLPAYAVASTLLYIAWRGRGWLRARAMCAMVLGAGLAMAVWWPMLLLIGRSTRLLHLSPPVNDVAMPWRRLPALIVPGIDGWPGPVALADKHPFKGYPSNAFFWDTASYIGILPLVAMAALLIGCIVRKRMPAGRWRFLACLGTGAFLGSLPLAGPLLHLLPGTILRSPARLLYLSTFCAAVALGVAVDAVRQARWPGRAAVGNGLLVACLALHFADLGGFAQQFVTATPRETKPPEFLAMLDRELNDGRIAEERDDRILWYEDRFDDAGGFDSIFLARFYRGLQALTGAPPGLNRQLIDASELPVKALEATGVRFVITLAANDTRTDLPLIGEGGDARLYRVPNSAPRADFFAADQTEFAPEQQIPELFAANPRNRLLLSLDARKYAPRAANQPATQPASVGYVRPSSDEIEVRTVSGAPGFVGVLEAYDPGWTATVDGAGAPVVPANGFAMAVPVPAGAHTVRLRYATPGRTTGEGLSLLSLVLLVALIASAGQRPAPHPVILVRRRDTE